MIIIAFLLIFFVLLFITVWLNAKFIKDSNRTDEYWHIVQFYQMCWIYLSYILIVFIVSGTKYLIDIISTIGGYAFMYISLLNIMRRLKINNLSRYDIFPFSVTVILFIVGVIWLIVYGIYIR